MQREFRSAKKNLLGFAVILSSAYQSAFAGAMYSATDLGVSTGSYSITGFNNSGQIVGSILSSPSQRVEGFIYANGSFENLGANFAPSGINASGQVVGVTYNGANNQGQDVVVRDPDGSSHEIAPVAGNASVAINDSGAVVKSDASGIAIYSGGSTSPVSFTWPSWQPSYSNNNHPASLPNYLAVSGISNAGSVTGVANWNSVGGFSVSGMQPFVSDSANVAHVIFPFTGGSGQVFATSPNGWMLGNESNSSGGASYFVNAPGQNSPQILSLPNNFPAGPAVTQLSAVNDLGVIVGTADVSNFTAQGAVILNGKNIQDLNELIPSTSKFHLDAALKINDQGQILVTGHYLDSSDTTEHLFLLNPNAISTPEPSTVITFGLSLVALMIYLKRKASSANV